MFDLYKAEHGPILRILSLINSRTISKKTQVTFQPHRIRGKLRKYFVHSYVQCSARLKIMIESNHSNTYKRKCYQIPVWRLLGSGLRSKIVLLMKTLFQVLYPPISIVKYFILINPYIFHSLNASKRDTNET